TPAWTGWSSIDPAHGGAPSRKLGTHGYSKALALKASAMLNWGCWSLLGVFLILNQCHNQQSRSTHGASLGQSIGARPDFFFPSMRWQYLRYFLGSLAGPACCSG